MSGLELLFFIDGGATVAAAASYVGLRQQRRDADELASAEELREFLQKLKTAHGLVEEGHKALSQAWKSPLSLFEERDADGALQQGVPAWAVACAMKARRLADESSALGNRADEYEMQLTIADREGRDGRGLRREPVRKLTEQLDELEQRIRTHVPFLVEARKAFDSPHSASGGATSGNGANAAVGSDVVRPRWKAQQLSRAMSEELPESILRPRGVLGEFWNRRRVDMQRLIDKAKGEKAITTDEKVEPEEATARVEENKQILSEPAKPDLAAMESLFKELHHEDWTVRRKAAEAIGRTRDSSAAPELIAALQDESVDVVRESIVHAIGLSGDVAAVPVLCDALRNSFTRRAAAGALKRLGVAYLAPIIFAAEQNDEEVLQKLLATLDEERASLEGAKPQNEMAPAPSDEVTP